MFKPFKPPLLKSAAKPTSVDLTESDKEGELHPRPSKKRRLIHVVEDSPPPSKGLPASSSAVIAPRKPLIPVKNPTDTKQSVDQLTDGLEGYYIVLWQGRPKNWRWREANYFPGENSRPKSTKPGMEMAFFRYMVDMLDFRAYQVGRWEDACSAILSCRVVP
ncbi:hypothetical protein G7Y89_g181 [Cudoniella acicularis]|uniref:Uncharacterized protein n=1 Tax=Cudoniella acicularis TaxID=354080 RepID=A0A8H4WBE8_9HELO|nr:hypothetical protein G7Y89_g181 [Cudoniella acicularis]